MSYEQHQLAPLSTQQLKEIERSLHQLKVVELQKILEKISQCKSGKKNDLVARVQLLVKEPKFQKTILSFIDMSRRQAGYTRPTPYSVPQQRNNLGAYHAGAMRGFNNFPNGGATMHAAQHMQPIQNQRNAPAPKELRIVPLPFYDVINTILEPMELESSAAGQKFQSKRQFAFTLPPEILSKIQYRNDAKIIPRPEIQLRFFNTSDMTTAQKDDFPLNCMVRVNEMSVTLPNIIPTNKPNSEPKRPSRPVDITMFCNKMSGPHRLIVEWTSDKRSWAVAVYFVSRVNTEILLERVLENRAKHQAINVTRNEIIKKLGGCDEDGIAMDRLKIGLICPLIKQRMKTPARCIDCTHLQCFDLESYLQMNEKRPVWSCPVCSGNASYNRLIIDEYFKDVISKVDSNTTEVELKEDGRFEILNVEEAVELSDDDDDELGILKHDSKPAASASNGNDKPKTASSAADHDIIILSDSDDDDLNQGILSSLRDNVKLSGDDSNQRKCSPPSTASSSNPTSKDPSPSVGREQRSSKDRSGNSKKTDDIEVITLDDTPPRPVHQPRTAPTSSDAPSSSAPVNLQDALARISQTKSSPEPGSTTSSTPSSFNTVVNMPISPPAINGPHLVHQHPMTVPQNGSRIPTLMNFPPPPFVSNGGFNGQQQNQWRGPETSAPPPQFIGRQMVNVMAQQNPFSYVHQQMTQQHPDQSLQHQQINMNDVMMNSVALPTPAPSNSCMSPSLIPLPPGLLPSVENAAPRPLQAHLPANFHRLPIPPPLPVKAGARVTRSTRNESNNNGNA